MVYGTTLRLPANLIEIPTDVQIPDPTASYAAQLRCCMRKLRYQNTLPHGDKDVYIPKDLSSSKYVFIRVDTLKKPIQDSYEGPYKVVEKTDKHFTLIMKGKKVTVSIDRLKPAYLETTTADRLNQERKPTEDLPLSQESKRERRVRFMC